MVNFTTLVTEDHIPGCLALSQSLIENSGFELGNMHLHVLAPEGITRSSEQQLESLPLQVTQYGEEWHVEYQCPNQYIPEEKQINQYKFNVFRLPVKKVLYIDADMLCLDNIEILREISGFRAGLNFGVDLNYDMNPMFNTGLFLCNPPEISFEELQSFGEKWNTHITKGDQPILNEFFFEHYPNQVEFFSLNWNISQTTRYKNRHLWKWVNDIGIKFLHYTHVKPWFSYIPTGVHNMWYTWDKWPKKVLCRKYQSMWKKYYKRSTEY